MILFRNFFEEEILAEGPRLGGGNRAADKAVAKGLVSVNYNGYGKWADPADIDPKTKTMLPGKLPKFVTSKDGKNLDPYVPTPEDQQQIARSQQQRGMKSTTEPEQPAQQPEDQPLPFAFLTPDAPVEISPDYIRKTVIPRIGESGGSREFLMDLGNLQKLVSANDAALDNGTLDVKEVTRVRQKATDFIDKYGIEIGLVSAQIPGSNTKSYQIYADPNTFAGSNPNVSRKPIADRPNKATEQVYNLLKKAGANLQYKEDLTSDFFSSSVFKTYPDDLVPEQLGTEGTDGIKIGNITLQANYLSKNIDSIRNTIKKQILNRVADMSPELQQLEFEKLTKRSEESLEQALAFERMHNAQIEEMNKLFEYDPTTGKKEFKGTIIQGGGADAVSRSIADIHNNLLGNLAQRGKLDPELSGRVKTVLDKFVTLYSDPRSMAGQGGISGNIELQKDFDQIHSELMDTILSTPGKNGETNPLQANLSYMCEHLSVIRHIMQDETVIIPKSTNFNTADVIAIKKKQPKTSLEGIQATQFIEADVDIDMRSVKRDRGAASSMTPRIKLSEFSDSVLNGQKLTRKEIRHDLNFLTGGDTGQVFDMLYNSSENTEMVSGYLENLFQKYRPQIMRYWQVEDTDENVNILKSIFRNGKKPPELKKGNELRDLRKAGEKLTPATNITKFKDPEEQERMRLYHLTGFMTEAIYNCNVRYQAFINETHTADRGVKASNGGLYPNERLYAVMEYRSTIELSTTGRPRTRFGSYTRVEDARTIPGREFLVEIKKLLGKLYGILR